jgi:hypothetical protein
MAPAVQILYLLKVGVIISTKIRLAHSSHSLNEKVIICGGRSTLYSCITSTSPARGDWVHHSTTTDERYRHSGTVVGDTIYLVAGTGSSRQTTEQLVNNRWVAGPNIPYRVGYGSCSVTTSDTTILLIGGFDNSEKVVEMNVTTGEWRQLPDIPEGRWGHGCTGYGSYVIVAGGYSDSAGTSLKSSYRLNLENEQWTRIGDMEEVRSGPELVTVNNRVIVIGGSDDENNDLDTVEELDTEQFRWSKLDVKMKTARFSFSAVVVDRSLVCE